jgi:hypothetical protein
MPAGPSPRTGPTGRAPVAEAPSPDAVAYADLGELRLKGFANPVRVLGARRS